MVSRRQTLRSIDDVVGMIGKTCAECEKRLFSLPGVYDDVTYAAGRAVFRCSRMDNGKHNAGYRIYFRTSEEDFDRLSTGFGGLERIRDSTMHMHGMQTLLKRLDIYAKFAENGLRYELGFLDYNGEKLRVSVSGRTIDPDGSSPQIAGYILG
ncbi:MAG: hypothetical protein ABIA12_02795 [Candidatus Aenigmatarchaeota archaeon]